MIDIAQVRADTPGCHDRIHFNNAGSSLPPRPVVDTQLEYLRIESRSGGYETAERFETEINRVYDATAALIGCDPDEVAITSNATESMQLAAASLDFQPGDRIITSEAEYSSNVLFYLHLAQKHGVSVESIPCDDHGESDPRALADMLDDRVKLVSISHMPTNGGLINPAAEIGAVTKAAGIPYLLDVCQTLGQLHVDVDEIGCDIIAGTGRKYLRGPRGTGLLYMRRSLIEKTSPPFVDNHGSRWVAPDEYEILPTARRYESWEFNFAAVVGLAAAIDYAMDVGLADIESRVRALAATLRSALGELPGVTMWDLGEQPGGIVTFSIDGHDSTEISQTLRRNAINTSVSSPASTLYDATRRGLPDLVRASVHYFNTEDEIERFVGAVGAI